MADLTPNDIVNKEFRRSFRGYNEEQVDDFLQLASDALYRSLEENQRLRAQLEEMHRQLEQYKRTEEVIKNTLVLAERTADEARVRARQEADLIRREVDQSLQQERARLEEVTQARLRMLVELRALLHSHLALLESQDTRAMSPTAALSREDG